MYGTLVGTVFGISPSMLKIAKLFRSCSCVGLLLALVGFVGPVETGTCWVAFVEPALSVFQVVDIPVGISPVED